MPERAAITGALLSGGAGSRMGGIDKGLLELAGRPLAAHVLDALRAQTGAQLINANRSLDAYRTLGAPVVSDSDWGAEAYPGPLAGIHAVLAAADTEWVLCAPCDAPLLPTDLALHLGMAVEAQGADVAVVEAEGRLHPVHALIRRALVDDLAAAIGDGERKVMAWYRRHRWVAVDFGAAADPFANINTPEELQALASAMENAS